MRTRYARTRGFTLLEVAFVSVIMTTLMLLVVTLLRDTITMNKIFQGTFAAQNDVRKLFKTMSSEIRTINYAVTGSYPIAAAGAQSLTFYADYNGDGTTDRIRYYLSGTSLMKGVIVPTGSPATYDATTETVTTVLTSVANGGADIFNYYDSTYNGTSAALSQPVNTNAVRLIKITLIVDPNGGRPTGPQAYTTQVELRNLKDNL